MLTKPPDYMISECGCPELWSTSESKHLSFTKLNSKFWNTYASWCSTKSSQFTKLLPLRETWTDYCTRNHVQNTQNTESQQKYKKLLSSSSNMKQQKNNNNEVTKRRSFHGNSKRFNGDATTSDIMDSQHRSRSKRMDNELDQF